MKKKVVIQFAIILCASVIACLLSAALENTHPIEITYVYVEASEKARKPVNSEWKIDSKEEEAVPSAEEQKTVEREEPSSGKEVLVEKSIDINNASEEELDALPGIGPALAKRIISYREENNGFWDIEELLEVSGIGEKIFAKIEPYVFVKE